MTSKRAWPVCGMAYRTEEKANQSSTMKTTTSPTTEQLAAIGFALEILSGPAGQVRDNDWPCIAYRVRLTFNGKVATETDYSMGVGHVKVPRRWEERPDGLTKDEQYAFNTLRNKAGAQLKDKALHASFAAKLAKAQGVQPELSDVLYSLMSDGEAYFDALTFEDWAANYGYDQDSRKAESIFRACDAIGRELARCIPSDVLSQVRDILSDY